mmetsp:Transcript_24399/g.64870  ORF Transcript_24399/g.64870 Transcript_24399/m.64870 type:complete len:236 (-) Transcript_24399:483-1190(-)
MPAIGLATGLPRVARHSPQELCACQLHVLQGIIVSRGSLAPRDAFLPAKAVERRCHDVLWHRHAASLPGAPRLAVDTSRPRLFRLRRTAIQPRHVHLHLVAQVPGIDRGCQHAHVRDRADDSQLRVLRRIAHVVQHCREGLVVECVVAVIAAGRVVGWDRRIHLRILGRILLVLGPQVWIEPHGVECIVLVLSEPDLFHLCLCVGSIKQLLERLRARRVPDAEAVVIDHVPWKTD